MKIAPNYRITNIRVNPAGETIEALEINGEAVEVGSAKLENNKEATIDVSTYTEPVEVTPSSGKDGMKKATITLSNIPGGDVEANKAATIDVSQYTEPVEITPTEGKDSMAKATITLDNIPSGADLEANKAATIDVSTYTEPVEITPTAGKDGMEKATVTLTNIPAGGSITLYAWKDQTDTLVYTDFDVAPDSLSSEKIAEGTMDESERFSGLVVGSLSSFGTGYTKVNSGSFKITNGILLTFTRYSTGDITLW